MKRKWNVLDPCPFFVQFVFFYFSHFVFISTKLLSIGNRPAWTMTIAITTTTAHVTKPFFPTLRDNGSCSKSKQHSHRYFISFTKKKKVVKLYAYRATERFYFTLLCFMCRPNQKEKEKKSKWQNGFSFYLMQKICERMPARGWW